MKTIKKICMMRFLMCAPPTLYLKLFSFRTKKGAEHLNAANRPYKGEIDGI